MVGSFKVNKTYGSLFSKIVNDLEMVGIISEFEEEYDCYIKYTELMHANTISEAAEIIAKQIEG